MAKADVEADFPSLKHTEYELSPEDFNVNCLAYAIGDNNNWWEPPNGKGQFWPAGFAEDVTVQTVTSILRISGFTVEIDPEDSPKAEAIAIYAQGDEWTHFARFDNGFWSSKLGEGHDIMRISLKDLEGGLYGRVY